MELVEDMGCTPKWLLIRHRSQHGLRLFRPPPNPLTVILGCYCICRTPRPSLLHMVYQRWLRNAGVLLGTMASTGRFALWLIIVGGATTAFAEDKSSAELVIQMPPYVIQGERVLPVPESWRYVMVPAEELTKGKHVIVAPGYEILSNLSESNTKLLVSELQYRQLASLLLWPSIVQALPRQPMIVVVDRSKAPEPDAADTTISWENEPISNDEPMTEGFDSLMDIGEEDPLNSGSGRIGGGGNKSGTRMNLGNREQPKDNNRPRFTPMRRGAVRIATREGIVTASIGADGRLATSAAPDEEHLAASLSQESVLFALSSLPKKPPQWFRSGLGWLAGATYISPNRTRITFADSIASTQRSSAITLSALLAKTDKLTADEELLAAAFTHYGLYSYEGKYAKKFMQFIQQQSEQPFSEAAFTEVFQTSTAKMDAYLGTYSHSIAAYKSHELNGKLPEMPAFSVREATQSEVARLQADSLISQGKAADALGILRIAYWRGEREPAMLAILAGLEERCGSIERAGKITQALMALPTPPTRAFPVEGRLRFRKATTSKKPEEKFTAEETKQIMTPLARAVKAGLVTEDLCALMSEVVLRSSVQPPESIATFLNLAANKYPDNATIHNAATVAPTKPKSEPAPDKVEPQGLR